MTEQEFLDAVLDRLPLDEVDEYDLNIVKNMIRQDYRCGWSVKDCAKATFYTEHVSPHFSERYACDKIAEISRKYNYGKCK